MSTCLTSIQSGRMNAYADCCSFLAASVLTSTLAFFLNTKKNNK